MVRPKRVQCGQPVFELTTGEYMLTKHAMEQAASRGMHVNDVLNAIEHPERIERPGPTSHYHGTTTVRYVRNGMAVVVDYLPPVKVVVTVLYMDKEAWDAWNRANGVPLRDKWHRPLGLASP